MTKTQKTLSSLQLAYLAKKQRAETGAVVNEPIAIIGIGCKFPGDVSGIESYWDLLTEGRDAISEVPSSRWNLGQYYDSKPDAPGKMYSQYGGFINQYGDFDADFFNISHREAISLDPQHRILLEVTWEALENAGLSVKSLADSVTGVFVGMCAHDYSIEAMSRAPELIDAYTGINNYHSVGVGRISYLLGLRGPSLAIDAACASSLVSIHLACQSLRSGESNLALAGGVNQILNPQYSVSFCKAHMLSADGKCRAFDDAANGFVRGEGCGIVVLKRLTDAIADKDTILAVIRGTAVNQDGMTSSLTVPNGPAQQQVINLALQNAHLQPDHIDYVEAHGTGTLIGDPIEFGALANVYGRARLQQAPVLIGSVKTNIGHLEGAAGVAGLIKLVLALRHKTIPPQLHFQTPNKHIAWEQYPLQVCTELTPWENTKKIRFGAVSAFGLSGTNAHIILEEAPTIPLPEVCELQSYPFTLSAKTPAALSQLIQRHCVFLAKNPELSLAEICFTVNTARSHYKYRFGISVSTVSELYEKLSHAGNVPEEIPDNEIGRLIAAYLKGENTDWLAFYISKNACCQRIHLPAYPFDRKSYQFERVELKTDTIQFNGDEFFFTDHKINGEKVLPATAYLDIMQKSRNKVVGIKNITWKKLIKIENNAANITLKFDDTGTQISIVSAGDVEHASGTLVLADELSQPGHKIDVEKLLNDLPLQMSREQCYDYFTSLKVQYGKQFKGVQRIHSNGTTAIAEIAFQERECQADGNVLHPGILDSALQSIIGLRHSNDKLAVPFSLDAIDIYKPLPKNVYAVTEIASPVSESSKFDCSITNNKGEILVELRGLLLKSLEIKKPDTLNYYRQKWITQNAVTKPVNERIILLDQSNELFAVLNKQFSNISLIQDIETLTINNLHPQFNHFIYRPQQSTGFTHGDFQQLIRLSQILPPASHSRLLVAYEYQDILPSFEALSGFFKTLYKENNRHCWQIVASENTTDINVIAQRIYAESGQTTGLPFHIRYDANGQRLIPQYQLQNKIHNPVKIKAKAVILISGGNGELGFLFAKYLYQKYQATVIIVGRTSLSEDKKKFLAGLQATIYFMQADLSNDKQTQDVINSIKNQYGRLDGIIHSAAVIRDSLLINKTTEQVQAVLQAKCQSAILLDKHTQDIELDFFISFSSLAAIMGNIGQVDYAYANAFLDAFSAWRRQNRACTSVSINWPAWAVGLGVNEQTAQRLKDETGMSVLTIENGYAAFELALAEKDNLIVCAGDEEKFNEHINATMQSNPAEPIQNNNGDELASSTMRYIQELFAKVLHLPKEEIRINEPWDIYHLDSIMMLDLTYDLEKLLGPLPKTLLFEHKSIANLANYLLLNYNENLQVTLNKSQPVKKTVPLNKAQPIAIIGIAGRYPKASNLSEFWDNLTVGLDCITEIPASRWPHELYFNEKRNQSGKTYAKWGGFIDDVDKFDPLFFNISPKEARLLDPQERLFLQIVWETLEDAGYTRESLHKYFNSKVGVFTGVMWSEYQLHGVADDGLIKTSLGSSHASIANRVSHFLDINGPSLAIDTMCSSSLSAVHLACESIRRGECAAAIAGGVNLSIHPNKYLQMAQGQFAASDGRCRSFGKGGDGYIPGEGVGAILLKPLEQALADGDRIHATIIGSGINHGGKTHGFTVPNPVSQAELISEVIYKSGIAPDDISYIEAHGTGTALGDPIEISVLSQVFTGNKTIALGSVKSNIGHLEAAAGMAAIAKVVLQLKHRQLVATLHSEELNPHIEFSKTPFQLPQKLQAWESSHSLRRAGVSSFGAGGANAHLIIEEYLPDYQKSAYDDQECLILFSAKENSSLVAMLKNFEIFLSQQIETSELSMAEIAYTLQVGREAMPYRFACIAASKKELHDKLVGYLAGNKSGALFNYVKQEPGKIVEPEGKDLNFIAQEWINGNTIVWNNLYINNKPRRISLPSYPFAQESFWFLPETTIPKQLTSLIQENISTLTEQCFRTHFSGQEYFLLQHCIQQQKVLPGAVLIEMARIGVELSTSGSSYDICDLQFISPVIVAATAVEIFVKLHTDAKNAITFQIESSNGIHARGRYQTAASVKLLPQALEQIRTRCQQQKTGNDCYGEYEKIQISYGENFKRIQQLFHNENELLALIEPGSDNVVTIDNALHAAGFLILKNETLYVPYSIKQVVFHQPITSAFYVYATMQMLNNNYKFDIQLLDKAGIILAVFTSVACRPFIVNSISLPQNRPVAIDTSMLDLLKTLLAEELGLSATRIEEHVSWEKYGMDSIMSLNLTSRLEEKFGTLPKTLFFEYDNLAKLTNYFTAKYPVASPLLPNRFLHPQNNSAGIAIIGLSGRYPMAENIAMFWENLQAGKDCITEIPVERWNYKLGSHGKWGGFIDDIDKFDPLFFNISPAEAEFMDPQERIFLETVWETIEDAGYTIDEINSRGNVSVFAGVMYQEYQLYGAEQTQSGKPLALPGSSASIANRISYQFNFQGPSLTVDTMCSSSLTAIHLACESILNGNCVMSVAGGVNLSLHPNKYRLLSNGRFLSTDGRCRSFGEGGDGYVPAEGVGAVLLKNLENAIADGDHIYAVIKGSSINHGGHTHGYTVPNPNAQEKVIRQALAKSDTPVTAINYIETHGTGTALGDPIEISVLNRVFANADDYQCAIGSVKSNIGHCESASGIAGLTKIILQMQNKKLVPSLHSARLNKNIDFTATPFVVQQELREWTSTNDAPRSAVLSSFGAGGSNACLIVQEYIPEVVRDSFVPQENYIIPISARTDEQLLQYAAKLLKFLQKQTIDFSLDSMAVTLQMGREPHKKRKAFAVQNLQELISQLTQFVNGYDIVCHDARAQNWLRGENDVWEKQSSKVHRMSLPTYSFEKRICWFAHNGDTAKVTHLFNTSDISSADQRRFETVLRHDDFVFSDHRIQDKSILPAAAYLELAVQAAKSSGKNIRSIKNVMWVKPVTTESGEITLSTNIFAIDANLRFEIKTLDENLCCKGNLEIENTSMQAPLHLDPKKFIQGTRFIEGQKIYEKFSQYGFQYGKSFHTIVGAYIHTDAALVEVRCPEHLYLNQAILHPAMIDAAFQATLAMSMQDIQQPYLPFSIQQLTISKPLESFMYVYVKASHTKTNDLISFDLSLINKAGDELLRIKDFSLRRFNNDKITPQAGKMSLAKPSWCNKPRLTAENSSIEHIILLAPDYQAWKDLLAAKLHQVETHVLPAITITDIHSIHSQFKQVFDVCKSVLKKSVKTQVTILCPASFASLPIYRMFAGLFHTVEIENHAFMGKIIYIADDNIDFTEILDEIKVYDKSEREVTLGLERQIRNWQTFAYAQSDVSLLKPAGIYWITGGLGGIPQALIKQWTLPENVTFILSGRSPLTTAKQQVLEQLRQRGATIEYQVCNVYDRQSVVQTFLGIKNKFGKLNGIIHSAGILNDTLLVKKSFDLALEVIRTKVDAAIILDEITSNEQLDFFLLFSSLSAVNGNLGQADYACANSFLDAFAEYREILRLQDKRYGTTISINWPLWQEGGMHLDPKKEALILHQTGLVPISNEDGVQIVNAAMTLGLPQLAVFRHIDNRVLQLLDIKGVAENQTGTDVEATLLNLFSQSLKMNKDELDSDTDFSEYGVDSIQMMNILDKLEQAFSLTLDPNTIVMYPTLNKLTEYLATLVTDVKVKPPEKPAPTTPLRTTVNTNKIAIVGCAGRFPKSANVDEFWENLATGAHLISTVPENRWSIPEYFHPSKDMADKSYSKVGGFIDRVEYFDPRYFGITDEDAYYIDPQQRIMLMLTQHLLDASGYTKAEIAGTNTSIFLGAKENNYLRKYHADIPSSQQKNILINSLANMIAGRIANHYNLLGAVNTIDTACSSSLVAIHNACKSLLANECDQAIAGGIGLILDQYLHVSFSQASVLTNEEYCRVFDKNAAGFVLGEAAGFVMLKRFDDAIRDGDNILAVIAGSAVNNDGYTMGLTVPNKDAQKSLLRTAFQNADLTPDDMTYLEAHGTATLLGDPIEVRAASEVFKEFTQENSYCAIGSVKSNIGHSMTAAGVSSLIKVILGLKHKQIPPTLNCATPHPRFEFANSPFTPNAALQAWPLRNGLRRAGISSFGFGGTNAHLVVEEFSQKYTSRRQPLPLTKFNEKYYWLGDSKQAITPVSSILDKLIGNEIDVDAAIKMLGECS